MLEKPSGIPRQSGCYLFRNAAGDIIYVGKARACWPSAFSSYFQREKGRSPRRPSSSMADAASVEWIVTPNELDALILENELIKDNQPRYNMRLKDDKSFPFVALDARTPFPAPYIPRAAHVGGVRYFGPFADVRALRVTIDELLQAFPLRSCSKHKFLYQERIGRPCLLYDIGKCSGTPAVGHIDQGGLRAAGSRSLGAVLRRRCSPAPRSAATPDARRPPSSSTTKQRRSARDGLDALERAASAQSVVLDEDHSSLDVIAIAERGQPCRARCAFVFVSGV